MQIIKLNRKNKIYLTTIILSIIITWVFYIQATQPERNIEYNFSGTILDMANGFIEIEVIDIEINGQYKEKFFGRNIKFVGEIKFGDETADVYSYGNSTSSVFYTNKGRTITFYMIKDFKGLIIEDLENKFFIAAPSENREEAIRIIDKVWNRNYHDIYYISQ